MIEQETCLYCGGECPHNHEYMCDGYSGDIDNLYEEKTIKKEGVNKMRIRVKAEETVYLEYFVDVPEEIVEQSKERISKTYLKNAIHNWIDENQSEFNYQDYDSDRSWYDWEEVGDEWDN